MKTVNKPAAMAVGKPNENDAFLAELNAGNGVVVLPEDMTGISDAEAFELMEAALPGQLTEMTGSYWKPSGPGQWVFKFTGMTTVTFDNEEQEAVQLEDKSGMSYVAAQSILVNSLKKVTELPTYVKVICDGRKTKGKAGDYYNMQVLVFPSAAKQTL